MVIDMECAKDEFNVLIMQRIKDIRSRNNSTREQLAKLADISSKYLYEIEMGRKTCPLYMGYKMCKCLNVDMEYIVYFKRKCGFSGER